MTRYYVNAHGERYGPYDGLNAVADCLRWRWAVSPDPACRAYAVDGTQIRELREAEEHAVVTRLVMLASEERAQAVGW